MGLQALHSAATGMQAFQTNLDVVANNLANSGTTGFKRSRVNFADLYYQQLKLPGAQDAQGELTPTGVAVGMGTRADATAVDHNQGSPLETERQLDVTILGDGFFAVQDGNEIMYTRSGSFSLNPNGQLVTQSAGRGRVLEPPITVSPEAVEISISQEGIVSVREAGQNTLSNVGQIETARFINPQGLLQRGDNLYSVTEASGQPLVGQPGLEGRGTLLQGFLESSNVEPVRELVDLIKIQRNFELNSQVVQAADQTLQLVANLRRF